MSIAHLYRYTTIVSLTSVCSLPTGGWVLQWQDNFDGPAGSAPDPSVWNVANKTGYTTQGEQEWYSPDNVYLDGNGHLVLYSIPKAYNGLNYTSGWVDTSKKFNATYGVWEISAKLPEGQGIWPAHWLMPDTTSCWPMGGEIDIMERVNSLHMVHGALHWSLTECGHAGEQNAQNWSHTLPYDPSDEYHTYGLVWDPVADSLSYYVDDLYYLNVSSVSAKFPPAPFYLILNTAVGGDWPGAPNASTVFPQSHLVDYVRWYAPA